MKCTVCRHKDIAQSLVSQNALNREKGCKPMKSHNTIQYNTIQYNYNSVHTCSISLVPFSYDQFQFANVLVAEYLMVVTLGLFRIYFVLLG